MVKAGRQHLASPAPAYEVEVLPGLGSIASSELEDLIGTDGTILPAIREAEIRFRYRGQPAGLLRLRTVVAVYLVLHFPIPRPKALLGHEHFTALMAAVTQIRALHPQGAFHTFRIGAAGADSAVFQRLGEELGRATGLAYAPDEADLLIRVRPGVSQAGGWEALIRLSPRPLATRAWRVADMEGALNGTIAAAMIRLANPAPAEHVLNLMSGSGTLLIEQALHGRVAQLVGAEINPDALERARQNINAAGLQRRVALTRMDAVHPALARGVFDVLYADLPWGQLVGSADENTVLYPVILRTAAELARPGARLVIITHAIRLFEESLAATGDLWETRAVLRVFQGGLHPRIYLLRRCAS
ncbi:MAG: methyltransferase domain-containing protein [Anaerolineae bacterium]|nr:methyltransferase domain-containing protein [Anaerolineae bacterium]